MPGHALAKRTVEVLGTRLNYVEAGSGTPVLLVAGWPQSLYAWRHVMPALAPSYRVVAVDPPGPGESGPPQGGYDTANIARHIDAFVDALEIGSLHFVGHDIGAWIGYAYAARHPRKVRRLALIDAAIPGITPADTYALTPERIAKTWHFYFNALPDIIGSRAPSAVRNDDSG